MADRIVVMKQGIVQQVGSPKIFMITQKTFLLQDLLELQQWTFLRGKIVEHNFQTKDGGKIEIPEGHYARLKN